MGKKKDIPDWKRMEVVQFMMGSCNNLGKPRRGKFTEAATKFDVCKRTISRFWKTAKQQRNQGEIINVSSIRNKRIRKKKHEIDYVKIQQIPTEKRGTIQAMSDALGIPKSIVGRWATGHLLRPHTNAMKPLLKAPNMLMRLRFSLQAINFDRPLNTLKFKPMENTVHIDEKWFFLSRKSCRMYLTPMEADPLSLRVTQSKNFIPKVMFMCAVCRPVYDVNGVVLFDGKIGVWPFVEEVRAKRNSIKRKKGTIEIKPVQSINREVIKECIIKQVIPAIKEKWPPNFSKNIKIQQDNARPHISNNDQEFQAAANSDGFQIQIVQQPANSPDCNVLDLGFHCAIQSLQQRQRTKNADELIAAVKTSFNAIDPMTLNKVFLSLQCVLVEILKLKGGNNYKQKHMKKNVLLRQGMLPTDLEVPDHLVRESIDHLIREEFTAGIEDLIAAMGITPPQNGEGFPDLNI